MESITIEDKSTKIIRLHRYHIITNIILIIAIILIAIYIFYNLKDVQLAGQDPCKLCTIKTGASCIINHFSP
jgi:hypothetical protein